jgi:hypothetical protein
MVAVGLSLRERLVRDPREGSSVMWLSRLVFSYQSGDDGKNSKGCRAQGTTGPTSPVRGMTPDRVKRLEGDEIRD